MAKSSIFPQNFDFEDATPEAVAHICSHPREVDTETLTTLGLTGEQVAENILKADQATVVRIDGEPAAVWYWKRTGPDQIMVGTFATALMLQHPIAFTRGAKWFVKCVQQTYPNDIIATVCTLGPHTTRFWLRVIGFFDTGQVIELPNGPLEYMALG